MRINRNSGPQSFENEKKTMGATKAENSGAVGSSRLKGSMGRTTYGSKPEEKVIGAAKKENDGSLASAHLMDAGKVLGAAKKEDNGSMGASQLMGSSADRSEIFSK